MELPSQLLLTGGIASLVGFLLAFIMADVVMTSHALEKTLNVVISLLFFGGIGTMVVSALWLIWG